MNRKFVAKKNYLTILLATDSHAKVMENYNSSQDVGLVLTLLVLIKVAGDYFSNCYCYFLARFHLNFINKVTPFGATLCEYEVALQPLTKGVVIKLNIIHILLFVAGFVYKSIRGIPRMV